MNRIAIGVLVFLLGASGMLAQLPTGTILGVVKDSSGAVVPGAIVTAVQTETNATRTVTTTEDGAYRMDALAVGTYQVTVKATGFQTDVQTGLKLDVGQEAVSDFTVQVGEVSQTISVTAEGALINTTTSSLGSLVNQEQITDLPLNGRNYNDLTLLQAGVTKSLNSNNATIGYNGTAYSSNGAPQRSNTYLLDGALQMSLSGNNGSSALGTTLGVDGILEYKVITNSFDAEYGMTMGSQMTIVTKSGTNSFHGDAFDFLRNNVFDARNFFDLPPSRIGTPQDPKRNPEFRRNQFGGAIGGPIQKDKTFFFGVYEGLRAFLGSTNTTTTLGTLGNPSGCHVPAGTVLTSTVCPQLGVATATGPVATQMANYLNLYPAPNLAGTLNGVANPNGTANNYGFIFDQITPEDYAQVRIDHAISANDSLFGRYTYDQASLPFVGNFNSNHAVEKSKNQFFTLAENHIFNSSLVNSARFSFSREPLAFATVFDDPRLTQSGYVMVTTPGLGMGGLTPTGVGSVGDSILAPRLQTENIFTGSDDVSYNRGRHSFKFGVLFNHYQYQIFTHGYDRGIIGFSNVNNFVQGITSTFSLTLPNFDDVTKHLRFDTMGFYAQDSWKIFPRLTLNVGMRYEPTTNVDETDGHAANLRNFPDNGAPAGAVFTVGNPVFKNPSHRNWSPRFGFAWDVFGDGKTALRGGFDVLYDLATYGQTYMNFAGYDPPFSQNISTSTYGVMQVPLTLPAVGSFQNSFRGPVWNMNQPHLLSYNTAIEHQFPGQVGVTVAYAGSHGINLVQVLEGNNVLPSGVPQGGLCVAASPGQPLDYSNQYDGGPATSCYFYPTFCTVQGQAGCANRLNDYLPSMVFDPATGESFYNALELAVNKRVTHGLQLQGAFTWSKLNDNQQGGSGQDGNDIAAEPLHTKSLYGPALFDVRDNFRFNALYRLPNFAASKGFAGLLANGWWMSGILSLQSGYPFSVTLSGDRENISYTPSFANRDTPDLIPGRQNSNITKGASTGCGAIAAGTKVGTPGLWYDPCAFSIQPTGFIGTEPRNFLTGPGLANVDFSLVKDTAVSKFGEGGKVEFRAEVFDLFNHPNFTLPNQVVSSGTCAVAAQKTACAITPTGTAGAITSTIGAGAGLPGGARQIQFGLKLMF